MDSDQIILPRVVRLIQPPGITTTPRGAPTFRHLRVNWHASNIDETTCVKFGNQQDQTGKVNEYADSDKRCCSKRENWCCHTQLVP
jgi:hypothetical protein